MKIHMRTSTAATVGDESQHGSARARRCRLSQSMFRSQCFFSSYYYSWNWGRGLANSIMGNAFRSKFKR